MEHLDRYYEEMDASDWSRREKFLPGARAAAFFISSLGSFLGVCQQLQVSLKSHKDLSKQTVKKMPDGGISQRTDKH
jgi:hypothetical protein